MGYKDKDVTFVDGTREISGRVEEANLKIGRKEDQSVDYCDMLASYGGNGYEPRPPRNYNEGSGEDIRI